MATPLFSKDSKVVVIVLEMYAFEEGRSVNNSLG